MHSCVCRHSRKWTQLLLTSFGLLIPPLSAAISAPSGSSLLPRGKKARIRLFFPLTQLIGRPGCLVWHVHGSCKSYHRWLFWCLFVILHRFFFRGIERRLWSMEKMMLTYCLLQWFLFRGIRKKGLDRKWCWCIPHRFLFRGTRGFMICGENDALYCLL